MVTGRAQLSTVIIGAGRMGAAIAYSLGIAGHRVQLVDTSEAVRAGVANELARVAELCGTAVPEVRVSADLSGAVAGSDLVIEAATENLEVKRSILRQVSAAAQDAIITTNTSSIPLRELTSSVADTSRFLGTHFWNPPYAVRLVEVVSHADTSVATREAVMSRLGGAGFIPVEVKFDLPGLIGNRLQHALKREAIALVAAGVCDAETVDTVARMTIGRRLEVLGPLEQSDLVGLDMTLAIHEQLLPDLDRTNHPQDLLVNLVGAGKLGMKTGTGFREWTPEEAQATRDRLDRHLLRDQKSRKTEQTSS